MITNPFPPGTKVTMHEHWGKELPGTYTIKQFLTDSCGEGCCQTYVLEEMPEFEFWPSQLQIIKDANE